MRCKLSLYSQILFFFFFAKLEISAQDVTPPLEPVLDYVTVDTANNNVEIFWKKSPSPDVSKYILYYEINTPNGYEGSKFDSVPATSTRYTDTSGLAGNRSVLYSISAIDLSGNESTRTPMHSTIYTTVSYDSCSSKLTIRWNKYKGWGNYAYNYKIYARVENGDYDTITGVNANVDSLVISKVLNETSIRENIHYYFYVVCINSFNTIPTTSNIATKHTIMPLPPDNLELDYVSVTGSQTVDLKFRFTEPIFIDSFALLRSNQENSIYEKVYTLFKNSSPDIIQDTILTSTNKFFYRIGALNSCGKIIRTSNLGTNILLMQDTIAETNQYNHLKWNPYRDFPLGLDHYEIYRIDSSGDTVLITSLGSQVISYTDDISTVYGQGYSGKLTYLARAVETGSVNSAYSNFCDILVQTNIWMPNAFTPNGDGQNDIFEPYFYLIPEKYLMLIYDRFGTIVFSTEDPLLGWDGRINGNNSAPEGVYIYHVQYSSYNAQPGNITGSFTVFYPK